MDLVSACGAVPGADLWPSDTRCGTELSVDHTHLWECEALNSLCSAHVLWHIFPTTWTMMHNKPWFSLPKLCLEVYRVLHKISTSPPSIAFSSTRLTLCIFQNSILIHCRCTEDCFSARVQRQSVFLSLPSYKTWELQQSNASVVRPHTLILMTWKGHRIDPVECLVSSPSRCLLNLGLAIIAP